MIIPLPAGLGGLFQGGSGRRSGCFLRPPRGWGRG